MSQAQLYMMKGLIAEMSEEDQQKVNSLIVELQAFMAANPEYGAVAFSVVALEQAVAAEQNQIQD